MASLEFHSDMYDPERVLNFPGLLNARDLGGYPTLDDEYTRWRSLLRVDDLVQLSSAGVRAIADYGVQTVIDLRWPEEAAESPHPVPRDLQQISYHQISLLNRNEASWLQLLPASSKEMWKIAVLEHTRVELKQVLGAIAAAEPGPLLFHCMAGKDRTGVIAALLLTLADVRPEAIAYDYAASTKQLRATYLVRYEHQGAEAVLEGVRCPEQGVYNMLEYLAAAGGIRAYLKMIGLSEIEIDRLRSRLRD
jgi:protein-tyrosine phosphatase